MKRSAVKLITSIILLTVIIFISVAVFGFCFLDEENSSVEVYDYLSSPLTNSETVYIILALALLLPLSLIALAFSVIYATKPIVKKNKAKKAVTKM